MLSPSGAPHLFAGVEHFDARRLICLCWLLLYCCGKPVAARQRLDLQRGWAEEKAGLRRASEDALRRAVEGNARAREEAALKVPNMLCPCPHGCSRSHRYGDRWLSAPLFIGRFCRVFYPIDRLASDFPRTLSPAGTSTVPAAFDTHCFQCIVETWLRVQMGWFGTFKRWQLRFTNYALPPIPVPVLVFSVFLSTSPWSDTIFGRVRPCGL